MRRILVVGITGAGKTTAAQRIAAALAVPFHELDTLAFGPGWSTPVDFARTVERLVAGPAWVVDSYGYPQVRDTLWAAADTVVWLDYPRRIVLARVLRRSLRRTVRREIIFGGNRETWRGWLTRDHPVWWSMTEFGRRRSVLRELTDRLAGRPASAVLRFGRPRELDRWLEHVTPGC